MLFNWSLTIDFCIMWQFLHLLRSQVQQPIDSRTAETPFQHLMMRISPWISTKSASASVVSKFLPKLDDF